MIAVAIYQMVPPLPHRFLFRPRFSSRAVESLTLRTRKEKTHQKKPSYAGYDRQRGLNLLQER